ncbi:hypothetical protein [uncultured Roseovarius sp.]|uniref:hypothetical protein n=1 Tax=uncultured Roseovarius sp. TaxID=293344 RepID=UPI00262DAA66|nr:hypothetical protein [uncultured Roseovarius sp.]
MRLLRLGPPWGQYPGFEAAKLEFTKLDFRQSKCSSQLLLLADQQGGRVWEIRFHSVQNLHGVPGLQSLAAYDLLENAIEAPMQVSGLARADAIVTWHLILRLKEKCFQIDSRTLKYENWQLI